MIRFKNDHNTESELNIQRRLIKALRNLGCQVFPTEHICTGFPDILINTENNTYFIELKLSTKPNNSEAWFKQFEGIQLYQLHRLSRAYALIFVPGCDATLCEILATHLQYELNPLRTVESPKHLLEILEEINAD